MTARAPAKRRASSARARELAALLARGRRRLRAARTSRSRSKRRSRPKLDVSPFQRVLVAGFVAGGTDDVDANQETVRLLRSQLRIEVVAQGHRRRRHAAPRDRAGPEQDGRPASLPTTQAAAGREPASERDSPPADDADGAAEADQGREGSRALRAAVREHRVLEGASARSSRTR